MYIWTSVKTNLKQIAMLKVGFSHTSTLTVTNTNTAQTIGSGDLPVLATPAMLALMENAAMLAVANYLDEGATTVGGHINSSHLKPSKVGATVEATATLIKIDRCKLFFHVVAKEGDIIIGEGEHLRFIVDKKRFMEE